MASPRRTDQPNTVKVRWAKTPLRAPGLPVRRHGHPVLRHPRGHEPGTRERAKSRAVAITDPDNVVLLCNYHNLGRGRPGCGEESGAGEVTLFQPEPKPAFTPWQEHSKTSQDATFAKQATATAQREIRYSSHL